MRASWWFFRTAISISLLVASVAYAQNSSNKELTLDVMLVNDPDFPRIGVVDALSVLNEAKNTLGAKLRFSEINFLLSSKTTSVEFLDRYAPPGDACLAEFEPNRVRMGVRNAKDIDPKAVKKFLERWPLESLQAFFPAPIRNELTSYEIIAKKLMEEFDKKIQTIANFRLANGESILSQEKREQRSYVRWICAMRNQNEADLVLTNAFILYDLGSEPFPHSVFAKMKVGGASLYSPKRQAIRERAILASTFSMVTDLKFFREEGVETLNAEEKLSVIGAFIVAHELGHAIFKLPDFYDHPSECLMTTKYETGYVSGYRELKKYPGVCQACAPWVEAKRYLLAAKKAEDEKNDEEAIKQLKLAIQRTPKHIDGSYLRYVADLSVDVAEVMKRMGNLKEARRWVQSALRIVPEHTRAQVMLKDLP